MLMTVLAFVIVFTIVVLVHEGGHFFFSRIADIQVLELGLGLGPRIASKIKDGTRYSLNLLPLGGFIRLAGMNPEEETDGNDTPYPPNKGYMAKKPLQKFLSVFGGPFMNIVFGFAIFIVVFMIVGSPHITTTIDQIIPKSPAEIAGLRPGDQLAELNGQSITDMKEAIGHIHKSQGEAMKFKVIRGEKSFFIDIKPKFDKDMGVSLIGFSPKTEYSRTSLPEAIVKAFEKTWAITLLIITALAGLITGKISLFELAGPVGIAQATGEYAKTSLISLIQFMAFLSINLGVVNLLPIPALDGGRAVFIILEAIRRKTIDLAVENKIHTYGFVFLLSIILIVTVGDILRIIN